MVFTSQNEYSSLEELASTLVGERVLSELSETEFYKRFPNVLPYDRHDVEIYLDNGDIIFDKSWDGLRYNNSLLGYSYEPVREQFDDFETEWVGFIKI